MMKKIFDGRGFEEPGDCYARYFYHIDLMEYFAGSGENAGYWRAYNGSGNGLLHFHFDGKGYGPESRTAHDCIPIELIQYWE